jgi:hypothetical protein
MRLQPLLPPGFLTLFNAAVLELSKDTNIDPADAVMRVTTSGSGPGPVVKVGSVDTSVNGSTFVTADGETVRMGPRNGCNAGR